jgi:DNA-binding NtrC family response regulator
MIEPRHLPEPLRSEVCAACPDSGGAGAFLDEMERVLIEGALKRSRWNRLRTAKELKIDRSTLRRKTNALGIKGPARRGRPLKK